MTGVYTVFKLSVVAVLCSAVTSVSVPVAVAASSNGTSTRFNVVHAFNSDTAGSDLVPFDTWQPQLVVITTSGNVSPPTSNNTDSSETNNYTFAGGNRIAFTSRQWQVDRDIRVNDSIWTRLQSPDDATLNACAIVVPETPVDALAIVELTAQVQTFCASWDIVILGFTSPLADDLAAYLEGKVPIHGQYAPRTMHEFTNFTNAQSETAVNRLFIAFPVAACLENAVVVGSHDHMTMQRASICVGPNCTTCGQSPVAGPGDALALDSHDSKRGLIVFLSCGSFLLGSALVFYVFFRKQFFMPSESTKPEKDLTANLAYVLRM